MKILKNKNYDLNKIVLKYSDYKMFSFNKSGFDINPEQYESIIKKADEYLDSPIPLLIASDYMLYKRVGDRDIFQKKYFYRRDQLVYLSIAEYIDNKGKYVDKIIDVLWSILEETSWIVPAHNLYNKCLPYIYDGEFDYIDLFSAATGADIAICYYLCKEKLDNVSNIITERIKYELNRRIIKPFLNKVSLSKTMWWSGVNGNKVNNWCAWITSNVLTTVALTEEDFSVRKEIVRNSLEFLDNFISIYFDDGGCDEGPSYWDRAGGGLFNALLVLSDMTNGAIDIFNEPLIKNMGEYVIKVMINENRGLNFADAPANINLNLALIYVWGIHTKSNMMIDFAKNKLNGELIPYNLETKMPYRELLSLTIPKLEKSEFIFPNRVWLNGIQVACTREFSNDKSLYLALKGGTNDESHNHNDIGNVIVFVNDKPIFVDAGKGTYTSKTFSNLRYSIWAMNSDYHNCATINGVIQKEASKYKASVQNYDEISGKLDLDLTKAYPSEANIHTYYRSAEIKESKIYIYDDISLENEGSVQFNYLCIEKPKLVEEGRIELSNVVIKFDKSLTFDFEEVDTSFKEVNVIPSNWNTDKIYRIKLTTDKLKTKKFELIIE